MTSQLRQRNIYLICEGHQTKGHFFLTFDFSGECSVIRGKLITTIKGEDSSWAVNGKTFVDSKGGMGLITETFWSLTRFQSIMEPVHRGVPGGGGGGEGGLAPTPKLTPAGLN